MISEEQLFNALATIYEYDTGVLSFAKTEHPCYLRILAMPNVIPLIYKAIRNQAEWWHFAALYELTMGTQPFEDKDRGEFEKIRNSWIEWLSIRYPFPPE